MAASTDRPRQPLLPTSSSSRKGNKKTASVADKPSAPQARGGSIVIILAILGCVHVYRNYCYWPRIFGPFDPVDYSVTIAAVSGIDPATGDLSKQAPIDPAFNLTLCVASPSTAYRRECIVAGTTVQVSYLRSGVLLATGPAPALCVEIGEEKEEASVIAWGEGVRLPGFVIVRNLTGETTP